MTTESLSKKESGDPSLSFSTLRFLIPPLRLLSAAMWQVAQRRDVVHYGMLEEFVSLVTETLPELMSHKQRAQLILGLQAKLVLELCRGEHPLDLHTIQPQLDRIQAQANRSNSTHCTDAEIEASRTNFWELIQTLLKDPGEREHFFQEVFPVKYGPKYDTALQILVWELLARLEQLLPVPDLAQTVSWLSDAPLVLDECMQSLTAPQELRTLLQQYKSHGHLDTQATVSSTDEHILSSLSAPRSAGMVFGAKRMDSAIHLDTLHDSVTFLSPTSVSEEVEVETAITEFTEVDLTANLVSEETVKEVGSGVTESGKLVTESKVSSEEERKRRVEERGEEDGGSTSELDSDKPGLEATDESGPAHHSECAPASLEQEQERGCHSEFWDEQVAAPEKASLSSMDTVTVPMTEQPHNVVSVEYADRSKFTSKRIGNTGERTFLRTLT
ncbi:zinc finger protein 135-like [Arapaima gigas]